MVRHRNRKQSMTTDHIYSIRNYYRRIPLIPIHFVSQYPPPRLTDWRRYERCLWEHDHEVSALITIFEKSLRIAILMSPNLPIWWWHTILFGICVCFFWKNYLNRFFRLFLSPSLLLLLLLSSLNVLQQQQRWNEWIKLTASYIVNHMPDHFFTINR